MPIIRAQVSLPRDTRLDADIITNTWYFSSGVLGDPSPAQCAEINDALEAFYDVVAPSYISDFVASPALTKFYDMTDAEPRVPVHEDSMTLTFAASSNLPAEVAICLSFRGILESGVNMARRRGRIYLGPLYHGAFTASTGDQRVNSGFRSTVTTGLTAMTAALQAMTPEFEHVVFSPTIAGGGPATLASVSPVTLYTIDNSADIQRRRGLAPSVRSDVSP